MPSITISEANVSDADAVRSCAQSAYKHYVERMGKEPAPMRVDFTRAMSKGTISIAKIDSELVGFAIHFEQGDCEQLENIAVLPSHQAKGIGKQLLQHVENISQDKGQSRIELYTNELMHENIALYKHLGYAETHRKTEDGFSRVYFAKELTK